MKKALFMGILFVFFSFGVVSYLSYLSSGKFVMPFASFFQKSKLNSAIDKAKSTIGSQKSQTIFKWQDDYGQWHYGQQAPKEKQNVEKLTIRPNQNVMDALKQADSPEQSKEKLPEKTATTTEAKSTTVSPYSPEQIKNVINESKNLQKLLDKRFENQNKILKEIN